jgi:hypothetical protein
LITPFNVQPAFRGPNPRVLDLAQLTCRANQGHTDIIARTIKPAPKKSERAFSMMRRYLQRWFRAGFAKILTFCLERKLTRRANHRHTDTIARVFTKPAPQNGRGLFQLEFSESDGGRTSRRHISHAPCLSVASAPPSEPL